jgi:hypothetical protein
VRRQLAVGRSISAGSSRIERLDPFTLPVRFELNDQTADEQVRAVEISLERVVLRRAVHGMLMAVNLPVSAYLGVSLRTEFDDGISPGLFAVVLEHPDPSLSLPLYHSIESTDIIAEWQTWARVLSVPLLIADADGKLREPFSRLGALRISPPIRRRRQRSMMFRRRPAILLRRRPGRQQAMSSVHHGEREIIARH